MFYDHFSARSLLAKLGRLQPVPTVRALPQRRPGGGWTKVSQPRTNATAQESRFPFERSHFSGNTFSLNPSGSGKTGRVITEFERMVPNQR